MCVMYIAFSLCSVAQQSSDCDFVPTQLLHKPRREYHGNYKNMAYGGYSVEIPKGLIGYDDYNPLYQHGFGIILGKKDHDFIIVDATVNSLEFSNPSAALKSRIEYMHEEGDVIESSIVSESFIGKLHASVAEIAYTCPVKKVRYVKYSVFALSPDKRFLYEVTLYSLASRYKESRVVLDKLLKSWSYIG